MLLEIIIQLKIKKFSSTLVSACHLTQAQTILFHSLSCPYWRLLRAWLGAELALREGISLPVRRRVLLALWLPTPHLSIGFFVSLTPLQIPNSPSLTSVAATPGFSSIRRNTVQTHVSCVQTRFPVFCCLLRFDMKCQSLVSLVCMWPRVHHHSDGPESFLKYRSLSSTLGNTGLQSLGVRPKNLLFVC